MTREEAIKELEWALDNNTIYDVESAWEYICAVKLAIESMQKQIPRKMVYEYDGYADGYPVWDKAWCLGCGMRFDDGDDAWQTAKFCPRCGQALDWEMEVVEEDDT